MSKILNLAVGCQQQLLQNLDKIPCAEKSKYLSDLFYKTGLSIELGII